MSENETEYILECETAGSIGNIKVNSLLVYDGAADLKSVKVTRVVNYGRGAETADELRTRYFESFGGLAFAGNKSMYREKMLEVSGVGGCRAIRPTIADMKIYDDIYIVDGNYGGENKELIAKAQAQAEEWAPLGALPRVKWVKFADADIEGEIWISGGTDAETFKAIPHN